MIVMIVHLYTYDMLIVDIMEFLPVLQLMSSPNKS